MVNCPDELPSNPRMNHAPIPSRRWESPTENHPATFPTAPVSPSTTQLTPEIPSSLPKSFQIRTPTRFPPQIAFRKNGQKWTFPPSTARFAPTVTRLVSNSFTMRVIRSNSHQNHFRKSGQKWTFSPSRPDLHQPTSSSAFIRVHRRFNLLPSGPSMSTSLPWWFLFTLGRTSPQ